MTLDAVRGYVQLVAGVTEMTRSRAQELVRGIVSATSGVVPQSVSDQTTALADELLAAVESNRENVLKLVRAEVERLGSVAGNLPLASSLPMADLDTLRTAVTALAEEIDRVRAMVGAGAEQATGLARGTTSTVAAEIASLVASREPIGEPTPVEESPKSGLPVDEPAVRIRPSRESLRATAASRKAETKPAAKKTTSQKGSTPAKKTTAKKSAAKKTSAQKSAAKKAATATKKAATTKSAAKKASTTKAAAKKTTTKSATSKSTASKSTAATSTASSSAASKTAAKKAPAKSAAAESIAAKTTATKSTAAKKASGTNA